MLTKSVHKLVKLYQYMVSVHKVLAPITLQWSFGLTLPTCHSYPGCSPPASFWTAVSCGSMLRSHTVTDTPPPSWSDWRSLRTRSKWTTHSSVSGGCRTTYSLCYYSYLKLRDKTLTRTLHIWKNYFFFLKYQKSKNCFELSHWP